MSEKNEHSTESHIGWLKKSLKSILDCCALKNQGLKEERDMLADENKKMAEYLIHLHECNKVDLKKDNLGWLFH